MQPYHLRRSEKAITASEQLLAIIHGQKYMTLALALDDEPYLVTLSYAYDNAAQCFYFHCAAEGRKMDYLRRNPVVWGQIVEDGGYLDGKCSHAFRAVQFRGTVSFLEDAEEKRAALELMIDHLESDPDMVKQKQITGKTVDRVTIGKVTVEFMTGKQNGV
ncbi:MAG: pyridoxamine 5'-phosphate oxidase family protein [Anaerolineae bacterium]|nr:pyridoxamine 5'-phosphate oxidase family protein [Anaerolineae bacterium]